MIYMLLYGGSIIFYVHELYVFRPYAAQNLCGIQWDHMNIRIKYNKLT
jgi:hypothetical protein